MAGASSSGACRRLQRCPAPLEDLHRPFTPLQASRHPQRPQASAAHRHQPLCSRSVPAAAAAPGPRSNAVSYHRSQEVLGVVILDQGERTPEGEALLAEFAAAYRKEHNRGIVAAACAATLESAMRSCIAQGANKIMVVPFCLSPSRLQQGELLAALAEAQRRLPGVRVATGETIPVASVLAQHIENQVKVVEVKPLDVPERYWRPEQLPRSSPATQRSTSGGSGGASRAAGAGARQAEGWAGAASAAPAPQGGRRQADVSGAWGSTAAASAAAVWSDDVALAWTDSAAPAPARSSSSSVAGWAANVGRSPVGAPAAAPQSGPLLQGGAAGGGAPAGQPGEALRLERRLDSLEEQLQALTSLLSERVVLAPPPPALVARVAAATPSPQRHPAACYQHVTPEEMSTLSPAQCEFLERKRSRRGV